MASVTAAAIDTLLKMLARERLDGLSVLEAGALDEAESRRLEGLGASMTTYETDVARVETVKRAFPDRPVFHVDLTRPWVGAPPGSFDIVIALGLFDEAEDWVPVLRFARQIAPVLYIGTGTRTAVGPIRRLLEDMDYIVTLADDGEGGGSSTLMALQRSHNVAAFAPVIVHVHMLKCAGWSVKRLLELSFGDRHFEMYDYDPGFVLEPDEITRLLRAQPSIASISSHGIRLFPPMLGSRIPLYVTFLRDPADQFVSYIKFVKNNWAKLSDEHRRRLPPNGDVLPARDLAHWLVTSGDEALFNRDYVVGYMTEVLLRDEVRRLAHHVGNHSDLAGVLRSLYERIAVELAISVLEDFFFVGIVEEMETSMALFRERLEPYGFELDISDYRRENVSPPVAGGTEWLRQDDAVGGLVLQSLRKDYQLYNHFKSRLRQRCAAPRSRHRDEERPRYERLAAAMPQYGLREKELRELLRAARQEKRQVEAQLRTILSSPIMRVLWRIGVVRRPAWVAQVVRRLRPQKNKAGRLQQR